MIADEIKIIRIYMRDPSGKIYTENEILSAYNDSIYEFCIRTNYADTIHTYNVPPQFMNCFLYEWEREHLGGNLNSSWQALREWQSDKSIYMWLWEIGIWIDITPEEGGSAYIYPWESYLLSDAKNMAEFPLNEYKIDDMKLVIYGNKILSSTTKKEIMEQDPNYDFVVGTPEKYYINERNNLVLYPRPSSVLWDDDSLSSSPLDSFANDYGINTWDEEHLDFHDYGIITDTIDTENNLVLVFKFSLYGVDVATDKLPIPAYLYKYIRYGALERIYGGRYPQPTLRNYWQQRKENGFKAIKKFMALRSSDREYTLEPLPVSKARTYRYQLMP